jgi:hypothetical protein
MCEIVFIPMGQNLVRSYGRERGGRKEGEREREITSGESWTAALFPNTNSEGLG